MARKRQSEKTRLIADQAVALAEFAATAYVAADQLQIRSKVVEDPLLTEDESAALKAMPTLPADIKKKLAKKKAAVTVADVAGMLMAISEWFAAAEPKQQPTLLVAAKKLADCLQQSIMKSVAPAIAKNAKKAKHAGAVFQFKVTLLGSHPPIWRRIRIKDCTLDELHEHIQTAMGWSNSHLHHFKVGDRLYGDPDLMQGNFEELGYADSTTTTVSDILPKAGKKFRFVYEYDFGDSWEHELLLEEVIPPDPKAKYPVCLEGERACPPEDCGGIWGYPDFLEVIGDPKHVQHDELLEWVGGEFDPEYFDPAAATKRMRKGLPNWRRG